MGNELQKKLGGTRQKSLVFFAPERLTLVTDKKHPLWDPGVEESLDDSFVQSIYQYGVLEAIQVRHNGQKPNGEPNVEVADGRNRVRATLEANKRRVANGLKPWDIPAIYIELTDATAIKHRYTIMLNEQRKVTSPLYRARNAMQMLEQGHTREEIAIFYRCTTTTVDNMFEVLRCIKPVQDLVDRGELTFDAAKVIAKAPQEEQGAALEKLLTEAKTSGKSLRETTKGAKGKRVVANATGRDVGFVALSAARIRKEMEMLESAIKAKVGDEHDQTVSLRTMKYCLGILHRRPYEVVESTAKSSKTKNEAPKKRGRPRKQDAAAE